VQYLANQNKSITIKIAIQIRRKTSHAKFAKKLSKKIIITIVKQKVLTFIKNVIIYSNFEKSLCEIDKI
jgi:hypothetical protein